MRPASQDEVREFVLARRPALYRTAFLLVGNAAEADDLVQATLVRVITSWERIQRRDAPEVFARRVMINLAASRWRRMTSLSAIMRRLSPITDEPDLADAAVERDAMWRSIQSLPVRMRAVVVLRYYEDLSEIEIAAVLGCSTGTVKSQCSKALHRLRALLAPAEPAGRTEDLPSSVQPIITPTGSRS